MHTLAQNKYNALRRPWQPGFLPRFHYKGFFTLLSSFLCIIAAGTVLLISNNDDTSRWTWQPSVYLTILSTLANIILIVGHGEGANVAWWLRLMREKTTIKDVHQTWVNGASFWSAVFSGRSFDFVALACILVALTPINGPLLQRASVVSLKTLQTENPVTVSISRQIPSSFYSAYLDPGSRSYTVSFLTQNFIKVYSEFSSNRPIRTNATGCHGTCGPSRFWATGLVPKCSTRQTKYNLTVPYDWIGTPIGTNVEIFNSLVTWDYKTPAQISTTVEYKPTAAMEGSLITRDCTLQAAIVGYPVILDGSKGTSSLDPSTTIFDDEVAEYVAYDRPIFGQLTPLAGISIVINNQYGGNVQIRYAGAIGYDITSGGAASYTYANIAGAGNNGPTVTFRDPTDDIFATARELMFRIALASANSSTLQTADMQQSLSTTVFRSEPMWYILAVVASSLGILSAGLTFIGYQKLGRPTSMSPIEIAKAFAPIILQNKDSNCTVDELINEIGDRGIRYGAVVAVNEDLSESDFTEEEAEAKHERVTRRTLLLATPEKVEEPHLGEKFSGGYEGRMAAPHLATGSSAGLRSSTPWGVRRVHTAPSTIHSTI